VVKGLSYLKNETHKVLLKGGGGGGPGGAGAGWPGAAQAAMAAH